MKLFGERDVSGVTGSQEWYVQVVHREKQLFRSLESRLWQLGEMARTSAGEKTGIHGSNYVRWFMYCKAN